MTDQQRYQQNKTWKWSM